MISNKISVIVFFCISIVIFQCFLKSVDCRIMTRSKSSRIPASDDDDEPINTISNYAGGTPGRSNRVGVPRLDNRVTMDTSVPWGRPRPRCNKKIRIINGVTRFREKGSVVRYMCSHGFSLFGTTLAVCLRDQWSEPPPICVRPGCPRIQEPSNGIARMTFGGAVVAFYCDEGYILDGNALLYCNGARWNGTEPSCQHISPSTTPTPSSTAQKLEWVTTPTTESDLTPHTSQYYTTENPELWDYNPYSFINPQRFNASEPTLISNIEPMQYNESRTSTLSVALTTMKTDATTSETVMITTPASIPDSTETILSNYSNPETTSKPMIVTTTKPIVTTTSWTISPRVSTTEMKVVTTESFVPFKTSTLPTTAIQRVTPFLTTTSHLPSTSSKQIPKRSKPSSVEVQTMSRPKLTAKPTTATTTTTAHSGNMIEASSTEQTTENMEDPFPDNTFDKFDEEISKPYDTLIPEFIQPISPHKLGNDDSFDSHRLAYLSIVGGIVLAAFGSVSLIGGIVMYCWRKNKGIARARPYDIDGRTLSASDAMEDFMWLETRDSRI